MRQCVRDVYAYAAEIHDVSDCPEAPATVIDVRRAHFCLFEDLRRARPYEPQSGDYAFLEIVSFPIYPFSASGIRIEPSAF